jgi:two-component system response regulator FixJ
MASAIEEGMPHAIIAIVDDDEAVRRSTCALLQQAGFDVRLFKNGDDFLAARLPEEIGCILLDLRMPGRDGLAVLAELRDRGESPPVLVVTGHGEVAAAVQAIKLGAHDFIEKPYAPEDLLREIEAAVAQSLKARDAQAVSSEAAGLIENLSPRERQVFQGMLKGQQNKIIAFGLGLSIRTVEVYRANLLKKLGAGGIAEAIRLGLAAGFAEE